MEALQLTDMLYALRNPAGLPFYPVVFLALGVLTFAMHIFFVQLMLGTSVITIFGSFKQDNNWRRLASAMLEIAKISVSVAIVVGVAPLLFVQVIYDPMWYTSNLLSANWVISFLVIMIIGYWAMYYYYFKNGKYGQGAETPKARWSMLVSLGLFLLAGWIMHSLTSQMLYPDLWQEWYAPNGKIDFSGATMHANNPWRYAFFILMAIPVTGAMLVAYRKYKSTTENADMEYLNWAGKLGTQWLKYGSLLMLIPYIGWMMTLPEKGSDFATSFWGILPAVFLVFVAVWTHIRLKNPDSVCNYMALFMAFGAVLLASVGREVLRFNILNDGFSYDVFDYKIVMDIYSTALFFGTFLIVGGAVFAYFLTIAWQVGQTKGVYTASPLVNKMGTIAIWIVGLWMVHFFAIGLWVWLT